MSTYEIKAQVEIDESLSGNQVINQYIKAIGGKNKINKLKHIKMKLYIQVDDTQLEAFLFMINNEKYYMISKAGEDTVQTHIYDGKRALYYDMEGKQKIIGHELDRLKYKTMIIPEIKFGKLKYKTEMVGIEKLDDREVYKLEVTRPDGSVFYLFFDGQTSLKLKKEETIITDSGEDLKITTLFRDYKKVSKVKIPFKKIILTDEYNIYMEIKGINVISKIPKSKFQISK